MSDMRDGAEVWPLEYVQCADWSPDGAFVCVGRNAETVAVFDSRGQHLIRSTPFGGIQRVRWSPQGTRIALATKNEIYVVGAESLQAEQRHRVSGTIRGLDWSTSDLLAWCTDTEAFVLNPAESEPVALSTTGACICWCSDRVLATGGPNLLEIWRDPFDPSSRVTKVSLYRHFALVTDGSGALALAGSEIEIVSTATAEVLRRWTHGQPAGLLDWSSLGMIASASQDGDARLWRALTGEPAGVLPHDSRMRELAFSPDGMRLLTISNDGLLRVW